MVKANNISVVSTVHSLCADSAIYSHSLTVADCPVACASSRNTVDSRPRVVIQRSKNKLCCNFDSLTCRCRIVRTSSAAHGDSSFAICLVDVRNGNCIPATGNSGNASCAGGHAQRAIVVAANRERISKLTQAKLDCCLTHSQRTSRFTNRPNNVLGGSRPIRPAIVGFRRKRSRVIACVRAGCRTANRHISRVIIAPTRRLRRLIVGQCTALGGYVRNRDTVCCTSRPLRRRGVDAAVRGLWEESNVILRSVCQTGNRQRRAGISVACRDL